jgi:hypothetical protein
LIAAIKGTLGKMTPGAKAADAFMKKQIGEYIGGGIGGAIGGVLGHPVLGAIAGTKALGPVFDSIIPGILKSVLSMPASGAGFSSAMKYGADIVKGERKLQDAALSIFNKGVSVKFNNSNEDREKLQKRLDELSENPEKFMDVGGHVGQRHLYPRHHHQQRFGLHPHECQDPRSAGYVHQQRRRLSYHLGRFHALSEFRHFLHPGLQDPRW